MEVIWFTCLSFLSLLSNPTPIFFTNDLIGTLASLTFIVVILELLVCAFEQNRITFDRTQFHFGDSYFGQIISSYHIKSNHIIKSYPHSQFWSGYMIGVISVKVRDDQVIYNYSSYWFCLKFSWNPFSKSVDANERFEAVP